MKRVYGWETRFSRFLEPFQEVWRYKKRRRGAPVYLQGLLLPGERKSIEPLAERVAPGERQQLHHFVCEVEWDLEALHAVLWEYADQMVGDDRAVLIVDDTALPKKGDCSVGVAPQYCGALGKKANCQSLVTLTLARDDFPVPLGGVHQLKPDGLANKPISSLKKNSVWTTSKVAHGAACINMCCSPWWHSPFYRRNDFAKKTGGVTRTLTNQSPFPRFAGN